MKASIIALFGIGGGVLVTSVIVLFVLLRRRAIIVNNSSSSNGIAFAKLQMQHTENVGNLHYLKRIATYQDGKYKKIAKQLLGVSPDYYGMKFISVFLAPDRNETSFVGETALIYLNEECNGNISTCGVDENSDDIIQTYFDFSQTTDNVNEQLNSQNNPVIANTYKYVGLEFCKTVSEDAPNVSFQHTGMTEPFEFTKSSCSIVAELDPPLVINAGDVVTISLEYDLSNAITSFSSEQEGSNCTTSSPFYCFNIPTFTPSAILVSSSL